MGSPLNVGISPEVKLVWSLKPNLTPKRITPKRNQKGNYKRDLKQKETKEGIQNEWLPKE